MRIVGIDPGSFVIAMGVRGEDGLLEYSLALPPASLRKRSKALDRFFPLCEDFGTKIKELNPTYCYVEEPVYFGSFTATVAISMICGGIAVVLQRLGIPFSFVNNSAWKRALIGRGNASKLEIGSWVHARFPSLPDGLTEDTCDAIAIAEWGFQASGGTLPRGTPLPPKAKVH